MYDRLGVRVAETENDIALAAIQFGTRGQIDAVALAIATLANAILCSNFKSGEVTAGYEVDNARDSVRAVVGNSAACQDIGTLDERYGNDVKVDDVRQRRWYDTTTVQQHQVAVGTKAAQVEARNAGRAVVYTGVDTGGAAGKLAENLLDRNRTAPADFISADNRNRAGLLKVGAVDTRTGDDDRACVCCFFGWLRSVLGHRRRRQQGQAQSNWCRASAQHEDRVSHDFSQSLISATGADPFFRTSIPRVCPKIRRDFAAGGSGVGRFWQEKLKS